LEEDEESREAKEDEAVDLLQVLMSVELTPSTVFDVAPEN